MATKKTTLGALKPGDRFTCDLDGDCVVIQSGYVVTLKQSYPDSVPYIELANGRTTSAIKGFKVTIETPTLRLRDLKPGQRWKLANKSILPQYNPNCRVLVGNLYLDESTWKVESYNPLDNSLVEVLDD